MKRISLLLLIIVVFAACDNDKLTTDIKPYAFLPETEIFVQGQQLVAEPDSTGTKAHTEGLDNYHNAFASIYQGRYLAGVAAGLKLNEMIDSGKITADQAKIGYVGAFTYAEVVSGYTSFFLGARSQCESATMEVTFTGSWYDETLEKEGANKLINDGCVLLSQHPTTAAPSKLARRHSSFPPESTGYRTTSTAWKLFRTAKQSMLTGQARSRPVLLN